MSSVILDQFARPIEVQNAVLTDPASCMAVGLMWSPTSSGITVNAVNALQVATFFACVRNISEDVAKLPLFLYKRLKPRGKERAADNPLYFILHDEPNPEMSSFNFRQAMMVDLLIEGNAYAEIQRNTAGLVEGLWPIGWPVKPKRDGNGVLYYEVRENGVPRRIEARNMLHLRGIGDGLIGWSILRLARETLGIAISQNESGGSSFKNNAVPSGALEAPQAMKQEARDELRREWEQVHGGPQNQRRTAVLSGGLKYTPYSFSQQDQQFLERNQFSVEEICRWFRMPPHKVQHLLRATFSNISEQSIEYFGDCLQGYCTIWEQEIQKKCILPSQKASLFAEHLELSILRGKPEERANYYQILQRNGDLSVNDVREIENMNPVEGGDEYFIAADLEPLEFASRDPVETAKLTAEAEADASPEPKPAPEVENRIAPLFECHRRLMSDAMSRVLRTEQDKVTRATKRPDFSEWLGTFYDSQADYVTTTLGPIVEAYSMATWAIYHGSPLPDTVSEAVRAETTQLSTLHVTQSLEMLKVPDAILQWDNGRAEQFASTACERITSLITSYGD